METDVHFRRDSNADHNRSEHQIKKKHNKTNTNNHINCNKSSKTKDKTFDGQEFNASKDKHQNKNKTQTQREKDNKHKKSSNSVKNNNNFDNDLTINTTIKCNNNKKNKDKDHSKDNSSTTSNHKINKNKDNHLKTNKDVINNNKSLNDLLDNNKSLSNRETSLDTNQKNSCLVVKEFKFFKEKAKKKNISEQKAATSKSSKVSTGTNSSNSCGTTPCKQVLKSCDVLSISGVSDGSAKNKSKGIGHKETKQCRDGSVSSHSSTLSSLGSSATSSANNISCDSKTNKLKTSSKTNKSTTNAKYSHLSDNCSGSKKNLSPNKTISQSSKANKNKSSVVETNANKCPKNDGKRKNKVNLIKDNPLYDEDIIDGFAILSFKSFDDIELTINGRSGQKKKKEKSKKEETAISSSISSIISSVSSCSSTPVSSQLKCYNKSNENKSSKLSANKHLKNGPKDIKNSNNKSETKNRVDSKVAKCSKKAKQSENNGNNNNNNNNKNKNVDNNKEKQKPNNVVNSVNSSKNQSLESSTVLTVNKKTSINEHKPEVSINKRESRTEEDLKEVQSKAILDKSVSEDTKSISLTTSTSLLNSSQQKSPSISLNSSNNSSISDCDKSLTSKSRSSVSNDSSLSSPSASSTTLPLISSDGESDGQLSDCHTLRVNVKNECESNSSNTCSLSKAPINTKKSNNLLTPPPLPVISSLLSDSSTSQVSGQLAPQQLCGSDLSKHFGLNHKSSDISELKVSEPKDKSVNGYERTFQSHFIESVLRNNTPPEDTNVRNIEDTSVVSIKHCPPSSPLISKYENNNKENNLNSLSKVCVKNQKTSPSSTSPSNFSDNNSHNYSTNASNCVKIAINETIPQSHGLGVKRPSSPVPSNQSTASKQIRYSSPNNQTNCFDSHNSVPQQSASTSNLSTSNSLSNLSQLSQSIGQNLNSSKERDKERGESTKSSTSRSTPLTTNASSPENTFAPNFSTPKSQLWSTSSSTSNGSVVSTVPHLSSPNLAPRPATPSIGLSSSLHSNHLPMFASPIPPVSLPSVGGAVAPSATPSPFIGDSLFSHQNQDFLRRELDTRFLASQDRTINIPPPPYMRPELHPHMHLTQSQPYPLNPAIGNPLMPASNPQLFEKYPKLDQPFYGRNALGLPGFPSLSPLLTPNSSSTAPQSSGLTTSSNTPFGSPGHSAAFQPKLNSLSTKNKPSAKSGRWCAMHVRIAWEIYHHQQKQHMDLTHKSGVPGGSGQNKGGADMLRPLNHLFSLESRPQELPPFSSALLSAASSRAPFESPLPSHHNQFGSAPASPHLSTQTTNFPRFPTFGGFGSLNSSLGLPSVAGPPTPSVTLFGPTPISVTRDLPIPGCLPGLSASGPDLWSRSASTRSTSALFPPLTASTSSTSSSSSSSWGGLKAEAERNRINEELYNKRKASESVEKEAKRFERDKSRSDDRLEAKHRDQSHNNLKHNSSISSHLRNGDIYSENKTKDWIRNSHKRDTSRSPVHQSHHSHSHSRDHSSHHSHHSHSHSHHTHSHIHNQISIKSGNPDMSAFDNNKLSSVGVKDELKDDLHSMNERERMSRFSSDVSEQKVKTSVIPTATSNASNLLSSSSSLAAIGLNNQLEKARIMGLFGLQGTPPPISPHFNANNPSDPLRSYWNPLMASVDPFKNLHDFQVRPDFLDRDNIFQRYSLLNSSGGGASLMERLAKESAEKEMLSHSIEKHNSKLMASHLRSNDASFTSGLPIHPSHTPHTPHMPPSQVSTPSSLSSNIFPANPYLNSLHSLSASAGSYVKNNKVSSALHTSSSSTSSSEPSSPSLGPTNGTLPALIPNVLNHSIHSSNLTNSKLSIGSLIDNPLEAIKDINNKTNETNSSSMIPNGSNNKNVDVLETNSR